MEDSGHTPEWTGPKVERTLRNGKHLYVSAFKAWLVEQARRPDVSVAGLALRHGVNANLLRHWMKLEHWPDQVPALLPVRIAASPRPRWPASGASVANTSCRCPGLIPWAGLPTGYPSAARTGCRSRQLGH